MGRIWTILGWVGLVCGLARGAEPAGSEFFEAKVRPLLVSHCQKCHGTEKQKGGLRLDDGPLVLKGGDSGPALIPGHPEKSRLIEAIHWTNEDLQMPPKQRLSPAEVGVLEKWVTLGAPWPESAKPAAAAGGFNLQQRKAQHWAWRPIASQAPPPVKDAAWPQTTLDYFILAKLEEHGLHPAPQADRRTLLRRLYFDLIGLPPPISEVEAFVNDVSPSAYEKRVDALLSNPHFGERWGRHWLDLVRYAETRGHEFDYPVPNAWQYRDYVIRAFNADVPYDQFVREHLAGDLLENPRLNPVDGSNESILGTGFFFLGEALHSPVDTRQDETDRLDNQVDTLGKAFLGLTVGCARCHDHKFDAISQKDYYGFEGFILSSAYRQARFQIMQREKQVATELIELRCQAGPKVLAALKDATAGEIDKVAAYLNAARGMLHGARPEERLDHARLDRWLVELKLAQANPGHLLHPLFSSKPEHSAHNAALGTQHLIISSDGPAFTLAHPGDVLLGPSLQIISRAVAVRDPAWNRVAVSPGTEGDPGALAAWGRAGKSVRTENFTLSCGRLWYLVRGPGRAYAAVDSHLMIAGPLHGALLHEWKSSSPGWRWVLHDLSAYVGHRTHVEFSPVGDASLEIAQVIESQDQPPLPTNSIIAQILAGKQDWPGAFKGALANPTTSDAAELADFVVQHLDLFTTSTNRKQLEDSIRPWAEKQAALIAQVPSQSATAPAMWDGDGVDEHVLKRGSYRTPGEMAPRRLLEAIAGPEQGSFGPGSGRLKLANLMLADSDPFPARVMANRIWQHLLGQGIVATPDNFGFLGQRPTHPELLDYLADDFRGHGWSIKHLIREIVLSSTYRMASIADSAADQADPQNLLLHRANLKRLEAEAIRDEILAVSGRLDERVGGPSTQVYLSEFVDGRGRPPSGPLDGDGRRSIYIKVRRNFLSPMMLAFDAPQPFQCIGRRTISNVPAQALILMNDPFVLAQARRWGEEVVHRGGDTRQRICAMYERAFARPPTQTELNEAMGFLQDAATDEAANVNDPRPWGDFAHVLFNAKEFIFIR